MGVIRDRFATPLAPPLSVDKNPVGSDALADGFESLNQIFSTSQAARDGTLKVGLNQQQFMEINVQRKFPSTYKFPGGCFVDPNEKVNQNDYSTTAAMQAAGWTVTPAVGSVPRFCTDAQNGMSLLTGTVFYGASAEVIVQGSGVGYVDFGNCGDVGITSLVVGGVPVANAYQNTVSKVATFPYKTGQVIKITAEDGAIARVNFVAFNGTLVSSTGAPCPLVAPASPCAPVPPVNPCMPVIKYESSKPERVVQLSFQMPLMVMLVLAAVGSVVVFIARRTSVHNTPHAETIVLVETGGVDSEE